MYIGFKSGSFFELGCELYLFSRELHFSWNRVKDIPSEVGQLTNLGTLNASINRLEVLPNSLSSLTSLHTLELSHNFFNVFPNVSANC